MRYLIALSICAALGAAGSLAACSGDDAVTPPIDAAIDTPVDPCLTCANGQICVQKFDGTCGTAGPSCVTKTVDCPLNACSADCEAAYCMSPYQCRTRSCPGGSPHAFLCQGP